MNIDLNVLLALLLQFGQLAGFAALIAVIVNIFKWFGLIKDGTSGTWFAVLNLIGLVALVVFHYFAPTLGVEYLDQQAQTISQILLVILGYVMQLKVGAGTADTLKAMRIPVIGASHTANTLKVSK